MPRFEFTAIDRTGAPRTGTIDATDSVRAAAHVRAQGLFPTEIVAPRSANTAAAVETHGATRPPFVLGRMVKPGELAVFTRQLATLLHAGLPLVRSLRVLERQQRNAAFRWTLGAVGAAVAGGADFSASLRRHPRVFSPLYASMVRAGEAGGKLDVVLGQLARLLEKSERLKGRIRAALFYPCAVLFVTTAIVTGLLVFVVPRFRAIFGDLLRGAPLPPLTRGVLAVSDAVRGQWPVLLLLLATGTVFVFLLRRTRAWDALLLRVPAVGELARKSAVARSLRTLGTLLGGGVPILQALTIARETVGNAVLAAAFARAHARVQEGSPLAAPLAASRAFPAMATSMIEVGEETGELPAMLERVAETYDDEVDSAAAGLTSVIEPVMIVVLAVVVGTIVVALFLPIVRILQVLSGG